MRRALAVAIALAASAAPAHAFPTGNKFDDDPIQKDGGGGIPFTGAPRWTQHTCAVCHTDPPGIIGIKLEADDPALFTDGWKPTKQYHMRVLLLNEWAGLAYQASGDNCGNTSVTPYVPCNNNGFALEMNDDSGKPLGSYAPVSGGACVTGMPPLGVDSIVLKDGTAVAHNGAHKAQAQWDFCWTAPAAGAGTITAYVAVVDGGGGDGKADFPETATGCDVAAGAVPMIELGAQPPPTQNGGCSAAGDGSLVVVALALATAWLARRRRRAVTAMIAVAALGGCQHVRPTQRETLAKRNMKFSPDPIEDQLDLHMQEAREGSAGGYGSSGGGCGCN